MKRIQRRALIVVAGVMILSLLLLLIAHLPPIQRAAWNAMSRRIADQAGVEIELDSIAMRLWPARLRVTGVTVSADQRQLATIDRLEARWGWIGLIARATPRLSLVAIEGIACDLRHLPSFPDQEEPRPPTDLWRIVEVGELRLHGGRLDAAPPPDVELGLRELTLDARLMGSEARLALDAGSLVLDRAGQRLDLGPIGLELEGNPDRLTLHRLQIAGAPVSLQATAQINTGDRLPAGTAEVRLEGDLEQLLTWWDRQLADQVSASGRLVLTGRIALDRSEMLTFDLQHSGDPISVSAYTLEQLHLSGSAQQPSLTAAGSWGRIEGELQADGKAAVRITLDQTPVEPALHLVGISLPVSLPSPVLLSGEADVTTPLPVVLAEIEATTDLQLQWPGGGVQVAGATDGPLEQRSFSGTVVVEKAQVEPVLAAAGISLPVSPPGPLLLSGRTEVVVPLPIDLDTTGASAQLDLQWDGGFLGLAGSATGRRVDLQQLTATFPGAELQAAATTAFGELAGSATLTVSDLPALLTDARRWLPDLPELGLAGGPIQATVTVSGTLDRPHIEAQALWQQPQGYEVALDSVEVTAVGTQEELTWSMAIDIASGATFAAAGSARPTAPAAAGEWQLTLPSVAELADRIPVTVESAISGAVNAEGTFAWSSDGWHGRASINGRGLAYGEWHSDRLALTLDSDGQQVQLTDLELTAGGARLGGSATTDLYNLQAPLQLDLVCTGLDLASLPIELPQQARGSVAAELHLQGSRGRPEGELHLRWQGDELLPAATVELRAVLEDGTVRAISEQLLTSAGPLVIEATVPLGNLPRPDWLWPEAPGGMISATAHARQLASAPLVAALGIEPLPAAVTTDLQLDLQLNPANPEQRFADLLLDQLLIEAGGEQLRSLGPVSLSLRGQELVLEPAVLAGAHSRIDLAGFYDLQSGSVDAAMVTEIAPDLVRELLPMQAIGPVQLTATVAGPLTSPSGSLQLDHSGGALLMRDPAMRITDLQVSAELDNGELTISSGSAGLNRGTLYIGGGWSPESGQGVVLELEGVSFMLPMGILSRWDGLLSIEPADDRLARVVGDLQLDAGLWDRDFELTGLFFGGGIVTTVAPDDPLHEVDLDLEVRGGGGVRVENNLGTFDVDWDRLQVGGTAAVPLIEGRLHLAQGGQLNLSGRQITVRSGTVDLIGEQGAEPQVEIIPLQKVVEYGKKRDTEKEGGVTSGFDAELMARKGLASGVGSVFGLENKRLRPAELSIETESDAGTDFVVGQQLGRQVALFLATDLTDVQERRTMLQLWRLRGLPGLAVQAFTDTGDGNGYAVIERLQWGGTKSTSDRPEIHRIRLAGDWPLSKRSLRRATGLSKGQPYDPFLLFVAGVRLERELAAAGYPQARVNGRSEGDERLPTLVFECDTGPFQEMIFTGDSLSRKVRKQISAMYQAPPLDQASMANMQLILTRHLAAKQYPEAEVIIERQDQQIVVHVEQGRQVRLTGPVIKGIPPDAARALQLALASPPDLATLLHEPQRAETRILRLLHRKGFHQASVTRVWAEPVVEEKKETLLVHLLLEPGRLEMIGEVRLAGTDPLGVMAGGQLPLQPGVPLDRDLVDAAIRHLRQAYREEAYSDVEVSFVQEQRPAGDWTVTLQVQPGSQRRSTGLLISGLRHLRESLLRRSIELQKGDLMRTAGLDRSINQLATFPPIERISVETRPTRDDGTEVELIVTERPRWTVGLGGRWTSDRGFEGLVDLRDDNLLGRGASVNLRARWEQENRFVTIISSLPPRPGRRLTFTSSLSYKDDVAPEAEDEELRTESLEGTIEGAYAVSTAATARLYYRYSRIRKYEVEPDPFYTFDYTVKIATLGGQYIYDRFDDPIDPRSGYYLAGDVSWTASQLGSDLDTIRTLLTGSLVSEPIDGWIWAQTLRVGGAAGLKGTDLDAEERFFAGGEGSLRGFERDTVGPATLGSGGEELVPAGGGALIVLNEELRIPVWRQLRVAVFVDAGQVWESWSMVDGEIAIGAGLGVRYTTPIGPVWADVAWPVHNRGISDPGPRFYIGIGRPF
jgi:translocation and assembly module TamA